jgi:hypothetical protein
LGPSVNLAQAKWLAGKLAEFNVDWTQDADAMMGGIPAEDRKQIVALAQKARWRTEKDEEHEAANVNKIDPVTLQWKSDAIGEGSRVMPVFLNLRNPLDLTSLKARKPSLKQFVALLNERGIGMTMRDFPFSGRDLYQMLNNTDVAEKLRRKALEAGYDGIVFKDFYDPKTKGTSYIAFSGEQIKSASGNRGSFDPTRANINESAYGAMVRRVFEAWDETKYERDKAGRFAPKSGGGTAKPASTRDVRKAVDAWAGTPDDYAHHEDIRAMTENLANHENGQVVEVVDGEIPSRVAMQHGVALLRAIRSAKPQGTLYRGIALTPASLSPNLNDQDTIKHLTTPGYRFDRLLDSWTSDRELAKQFSEGEHETGFAPEGATPFILVMHGGKAVDVSELSSSHDIQQMGEFLTGGTFEVVSAKRRGKGWEIEIQHLDTIDPETLPDPANVKLI